VLCNAGDRSDVEQWRWSAELSESALREQVVRTKAVEGNRDVAAEKSALT